MRTTFGRLKKNKASRPDNISPAVLHHCVAELAPVLTYIINMSLHQCSVHHFLKQSTIFPMPESNKTSCLNDYRPIALKFVAIKSFECIIPPAASWTHISLHTEPTGQWKIQSAWPSITLCNTWKPQHLRPHPVHGLWLCFQHYQPSQTLQ